MVTNYEGGQIEFDEELPLLPVRNLTVYPFMILPLFVGRESSLKAVEHALTKSNRFILLAGQKDINTEHPGPMDIYRVGTVAMIMRMRKLPDGRIKILVQGLSKVRITEFKKTTPYFITRLIRLNDTAPTCDEKTIKLMMKTIRDQLEGIISMGKILGPDLLTVLDEVQSPGRFANIVASNLGLHTPDAQIILETLDPVERLQKIHDILARELEILADQNKIRNSKEQQKNKKNFLKEQMSAIKSELGDSPSYDGLDDELQEFQSKISNANMPKNVEKEALKQLNRLEKMHPDSSESTIVRSYLEWLTDLPWSISSQEEIDLNKAKKILDEDHFDLIKIKERILEHLAVQKLKGKKMRGPILCLTGPPGVGKTSLGRSIARSCGRPFVRISLGGVKDEAEIRGHRRTYVGSMPGRLIQAIKQAGTNDPVILLDEIDKVGGDYRGDPSSALLEVLDPEQNKEFRDHYLNVPFDLSNVMFIATSNIIQNISPPLKDRLEILALSGYTEKEKTTIAKQFLIPKQLEESGINKEHIEFPVAGIQSLIRHFTSEAGLRDLERKIGALCRKVAHKIATGFSEKTSMTPDVINELIGPAPFNEEDRKQINEIGVATGLAWTSAGGEILYIETSHMKGKGLTLTGQLGDVMKESAQTAVGYIRTQASNYGIDEEIFEESEIHIHLPAGATPKDGPSAGVTLVTALISLFTKLPVNAKVAMTGEITLTGKVLPIGGLKEKALAAMQMGISTVIIPWKNQKDLVDIPEELKKKIKFVPVKTVDEVLKLAIIGWKKQRRPKSLAKDNPFAA